jgi:hypothetical protein
VLVGLMTQTGHDCRQQSQTRSLSRSNRKVIGSTEVLNLSTENDPLTLAGQRVAQGGRYKTRTCDP